MEKTALITGASEGIGAELAHLLARDGCRLMLVARRGERLAALADTLHREYGIQALTMAIDLARPDAPQAVCDQMERLGLHADILVNNAGFGNFGSFAHTDWARESDMINLNVHAVVHLTKLILPGMVHRGGGRILNLASTAAFEPGPLMAVYYASKAFVLSFSEALARELKGSGVTVTALCPGPTKTGFEAAAKLRKSKLFHSLPPADAAAVARYGYRAMLRGRAVAIPGIANKLMIFGVRLTPRSAMRNIIYGLQGRIDGV